MPVLVSFLCMPWQSYTLMGSWIQFVANNSKGYLHFMDWDWKVISFGCDVTSGEQNCVEFGVVYWIRDFNAGMFLGEKTTTPIWQSIITQVIFENGSDSQGIRGRWKISLLSVNKHLFLGWLEVFCFALWGQSFCSSKLLFYFRVHEESINWSGFSQMNKSFLTFSCFILSNWLFSLLGVNKASSARILDVIRSVKESTHKKMSKRMYI
jgi:hypothetical protein